MNRAAATIPAPQCMRSKIYPHEIRRRPFHLFFAHQVPRFAVRWTRCLVRHRPNGVTALGAMATGQFRRCRYCNRFVPKHATL